MINDDSSPEAKLRYKNFWGGLPELPEQRAARIAAQRQARYSQEPARQLGDYIGARRSKFEPQPNESDAAFTARLRGIGLQHLTERLGADELERVAAAYNSAVQRQEGGSTHAQLREHLDSRTSGSGVGITGLAESAHDRAAAWHASLNRPGRDGATFAYEANAASQPASAAEINMIIAERERAQRAQQPQKVDVSGIRSSGSDFQGVDRV